MRRPRAWVALAALAASIGLGVAASAQPQGARVVEAGTDRVAVDWTSGLVTATGAGAANLRAPRPDVARLAAEREARARARAALAARARALPLADGRRVGDALEGDAAERFERALEGLVDIEVDYASDGSVVLTAGLPLEAVRLAIDGTPGIARADQAAPTALIIDARGVLARPALGLGIAIGDRSYRGPTVFHADPKAAAADPRLGPRAVSARAVEARSGALVLEPSGEVDSERLEQAAGAGALVVVMVGERS